MKRFTLSVASAIFLAFFVFASAKAQTPTSAVGTVDSTFTPGGKFNAQFFGDYYYKLHADSLGRDSKGQYTNGLPKNANDFQLRRVYLGYNYDISRSFTTEFLLAYEEGNAGTTLDNSGERSVYMKLANIQWKNIYWNATAVFGAQATPAYVFTSESNWGYRSIEKTLTDKNGIIKSSDLGLGIRGAFNNEKEYGYDLLLADGTGQTLPTLVDPKTNNAGRDKKLYVDLWGKFLEKKLVVQAYFDDQKTNDVAPGMNVSTLKFYAAYVTPMITVGGELFMQTKTNAVSDTNAGKFEIVDQKPFGFSVFATAQIVENELNAFARFDSFNPDNNYSSTVKYVTGDNGTTSGTTFIVAGLDWTPYKNVHIMPNLWYQGYSAKNSNATGLTKSDNDVVPRITFFYKY